MVVTTVAQFAAQLNRQPAAQLNIPLAQASAEGGLKGEYFKGRGKDEPVLLRIDPMSLTQLLHSTIDPETRRSVIATGLPASPGAVSGLIIF